MYKSDRVMDDCCVCELTAPRVCFDGLSQGARLDGLSLGAHFDEALQGAHFAGPAQPNQAPMT